LGAQRDGAERRTRRLTDCDDVHRTRVRKQGIDEAVEHRHVFVEAESARVARHVACIDPIGDADVAVGQQGLDRLPHHHGRVAGQRNAEQDHASCARVREAPQRAKRSVRDDRFVDIDVMAVHVHRFGSEPCRVGRQVEQGFEQVVVARRRGIGPKPAGEPRDRVPRSPPLPLPFDQVIPHEA